MSHLEVRLGSLAEITVSNVDKHTVEGQVPVRLCNYTDVYYNHTLDQSRDYMTASATTDQVAKFRLHAGDVVITKDSETADDIGIPALITETAPDFVCGYHLAIIRPDREAADPRYLNWALGSRYLASQFEGIAPGVTRVGLKTGRIKTLKIPVPGGPEVQARIADYLDRETATIDTLIEKKNALRATLQERRQAVIDRTFSGVDVSVPMRRHLVVNDSGAWGDEPSGTHDVPVLRSTEQSVDGYWSIDDPAMRQLSPTERKNTTLKSGDLIVTKTSGSFRHVGKATLVTQEVASQGYGFGNFMQRLRPSPLLDSKFLWWFLRTDRARSWIHVVATTSTGLMNLNGTTLGRMAIPVPPLDEQRAITDHLDEETAKIDALIAKAERFIELAQERRAALITAAVTGKFEIPGKD